MCYNLIAPVRYSLKCRYVMNRAISVIGDLAIQNINCPHLSPFLCTFVTCSASRHGGGWWWWWAWGGRWWVVGVKH